MQGLHVWGLVLSTSIYGNTTLGNMPGKRRSKFMLLILMVQLQGCWLSHCSSTCWSSMKKSWLVSITVIKHLQKNNFDCSCKLISFFFMQDEKMWVIKDISIGSFGWKLQKNWKLFERNKKRRFYKKRRSSPFCNQYHIQHENLLSYMCFILWLSHGILEWHCFFVLHPFAHLCSYNACFNHNINCLQWQQRLDDTASSWHCRTLALTTWKMGIT